MELNTHLISGKKQRHSRGIHHVAYVIYLQIYIMTRIPTEGERSKHSDQSSVPQLGQNVASVASRPHDGHSLFDSTSPNTFV